MRHDHLETWDCRVLIQKHTQVSTKMELPFRWDAEPSVGFGWAHECLKDRFWMDIECSAGTVVE